jgi:hypothetical protein
MAALAEQRDSTDQKFGNVAAVGGVAAQAILFNGWMLPHEGTPLVRMAFVAEFVRRIRLDHLRPEATVVIVAVRTFHFSISYGVVGLLISLGPKYTPNELIVFLRI